MPKRFGLLAATAATAIALGFAGTGASTGASMTAEKTVQVAPTNEAFAKLPAGTVDNLVKPENKATLAKILTFHVVAGRHTAPALMKEVKNGGGMAKLKTVEGEELVVKQAGPGKLSVSDRKGALSMITIADVLQSNGVIHVVDTVLMPM
jgi:uncharacterized surface protein with fasciclin (FAS1) repeats